MTSPRTPFLVTVITSLLTSTLSAQVDWLPLEPPGKTKVAMAYDEARQRLVLFGSNIGQTPLTWEWDGGNWQRRTVANSPVRRHAPATVYDSARQRVLLFGGKYNNTRYRDTCGLRAAGER